MSKDYSPLFERFSQGLKESGDGWFSGYCPFHEQGGKEAGHKSPSFAFNASSGGWKCFGCRKKGNAIDFAGLNTQPAYDPSDRECKNQAMLEVQKHLPWFEVRSNASGDPLERTRGRKGVLPSSTKVEERSDALLQHQKAMGYLLKHRGWTEKVIREHYIGISEDERYFWLPIYAGGHLQNIRKYSPKGEEPWDQTCNKISGIKGRNEVRIFPDAVLDDAGKDKVFLVEGEGDALAANSAGIPAVTFTGGAGNTPSDMHRFRDREVVLLYDNDKAGEEGAKKVSQALRRFTQQIKVLELGDLCSDANDITDAIVSLGHDEVKRLVIDAEKASEFEPTTLIQNAPVRDVGFDEAINSTNIGAQITLKAMVMGTRERPYAAYSRVSAVCEGAGGKPFCSLCPLAGGHCFVPANDTERFTEKDMLTQIRKPDSKIRSVLKQTCGFLCDDFEVNPVNSEIESVYELVIGPYHEDGHGESVGFQQRTVFACNSGKQYRINQPYQFEGVTIPQPWDQANTHFFTKHDEIERAVDEFKISEEDRKRLGIFKA